MRPKCKQHAASDKIYLIPLCTKVFCLQAGARHQWSQFVMGRVLVQLFPKGKGRGAGEGLEMFLLIPSPV